MAVLTYQAQALGEKISFETILFLSSIKCNVHQLMKKYSVYTGGAVDSEPDWAGQDVPKTDKVPARARFGVVRIDLYYV